MHSLRSSTLANDKLLTSSLTFASTPESKTIRGARKVHIPKSVPGKAQVPKSLHGSAIFFRCPPTSPTVLESHHFSTTSQKGEKDFEWSVFPNPHSSLCSVILGSAERVSQACYFWHIPFSLLNSSEVRSFVMTMTNEVP